MSNLHLCLMAVDYAFRIRFSTLCNVNYRSRVALLISRQAALDESQCQIKNKMGAR